MKNQPVIVLSALFIAMSVTACDSNSNDSSNDGGKENRDAEPVVVGVINPVTGPVSQAGVRVENDLVLAQQEINDAGGILGRSLKFVHRDSQANPESAAAAARELIDEEGVEVIYGSVISGVTKAILGESVGDDVLVVNGTSSAFSLSEQDNKGLFARTAASTELEGSILAGVALRSDYKNIAIIASESDYTIGLAKGFKASYEAMDCGKSSCKATILSYPEDQDPAIADHQSLVEEALDENPDAIYLCSYAENGIAYLNAGTNLGYTGTWFVAQPLRREEVLVLLDQNTLNRLQGIDAVTRTGEPDFERYNDRFKEQWGTESGSGGTVYDAIMMMAFAANRAGEWNGPKIAESIREVTGGSGTIIRALEYEKGLQALESGGEINYDGASGKLEIDEKGNVTDKAFEWWKIVDGEFETVDVVDSAEAQQ